MYPDNTRHIMDNEQNNVFNDQQPEVNTSYTAQGQTADEPVKKQSGLIKGIKYIGNNHVALAISSAILLVLGIFMLLKDGDKMYGEKTLNYITGIIIILYVFFFLISKIRFTKSKAMIFLQILECLFMVAIAILLIMVEIDQKDSLEFLTTPRVLGMGLWLRGFVQILSAYYYRGTEDKVTIKLYSVILNILMLSVGVAMLSIEIPQNKLATGVAIIILVLSVFLAILAIVQYRRKKRNDAAAEKEAIQRRRRDQEERRRKLQEEENNRNENELLRMEIARLRAQRDGQDTGAVAPTSPATFDSLNITPTGDDTTGGDTSSDGEQ